MNIIHCSAFGLIVLHTSRKFCVGVLRCLTTEATFLDHVDKSGLQLKAFSALVGVQSSRDMAAGRG
jgi:hypothetical protein